MADPFLLAHLVGPLFFDIGGRLSPVSIRDQMIRGRMVVDRAMEEGLIDGEHRKLLVIGAGAAGATAAIRAAQRGVTTHLIDIAPLPFLRQASCRTRWVNPTQYDWPVDHWPENVYPWKRPHMPLPWREGLASDLAIAWAAELKRAGMKFKHLRTRCSTIMLGYHVSGRILRVQLSGAPLPPQENFGMIVSAVGFGTEKATVGSYSGFRFWDTDVFEQPNVGVPGVKGPPKVLISGGGDGGLQDFLRILFHKPAGEIYQRLRNASASNQNAEMIWKEIDDALQSVEDQAQRAYAWGEKKLHDHVIHSALHQAHIDAVDKLRLEPSIWPGIRGALYDDLDAIHGPAVPIVRLAYSCTHFAQCYGLNRFLVLLIAQYLEQERSETPLLDNREVLTITGHGHVCAHNPTACHGEKHEIVFRQSDCYGRGNALQEDDDKRFYNVVIIRHGIDPPKFLFGTSPISHPRQVLPYHASS